jgi:hypothetical protein
VTDKWTRDSIVAALLWIVHKTTETSEENAINHTDRESLQLLQQIITDKKWEIITSLAQETCLKDWGDPKKPERHNTIVREKAEAVLETVEKIIQKELDK